MSATKVTEFLGRAGVKFETIEHPVAYTASEVAASAHVVGRDFAKTVIVNLDGELAMVVLPASRRLILSDLRDMLGTENVRLATESEFRSAFPDCEVGAEPPFGNLYGMRVFVAASLANEKTIAFNAGTHTEVIQMSFEEFARLVRPTIVDLVTT